MGERVSGPATPPSRCRRRGGSARPRRAAAPAEELDPGRRADLRVRREERARARPGRRRSWPGTPAPPRPAPRCCAGWPGRRRSPRAASSPRSSRLTSICSTVVMIVEPPGEPSASNGRPSSQHDRRRHRAARPLARAGQVRVGRRALGGREVEVGQLVVEQEAAAGHDDAVAAGRLDGQRVRHHVAPPVGDGQVGRRRAPRTASRGRRRPRPGSRRSRRPGCPAGPG